ncbi:hypothetical protein CPB86DRAFT_490202 [Serendipita vermifera]|nr:hypothetical protein CPB86DRAFT_490202 [Serendipita vermifera]
MPPLITLTKACGQACSPPLSTALISRRSSESGDEENGVPSSKAKTDTALAVTLVLIALMAMGGTIFLLYRHYHSRKAERRAETASVASFRSYIMPIDISRPIWPAAAPQGGAVNVRSSRQTSHAYRSATSPWTNDTTAPRRAKAARPAVRPRPGNFFHFSFLRKSITRDAQDTTVRRPFTLQVAPGASKSAIRSAALSFAVPHSMSRPTEQAQANEAPSDPVPMPAEVEPQPSRLISPPAQLSVKIQSKREAARPIGQQPGLSHPLSAAHQRALSSPNQPPTDSQSPTISHPYSSLALDSEKSPWFISTNPIDNRHRRKLTVSTALASLGVQRASALFDSPLNAAESTVTESSAHNESPRPALQSPVPISATGRFFHLAPPGEIRASLSDQVSEAPMSSQDHTSAQLSVDTSSTIGNVGSSEVSTTRQPTAGLRREERDVKRISRISGFTFGHKRSSSETRVTPVGRPRLRPLTLVTLSRSPPPPPYTPEDENPSAGQTPTGPIQVQPIASSSKVRDPGMTISTGVPGVTLPPRAHVNERQKRNMSESRGDMFFTRRVLGPSHLVQERPMTEFTSSSSPRELPSLPSTSGSTSFPNNWPVPPTTIPKGPNPLPLIIPHSPIQVDMIVSASHVPDHFLVDD